MNIVLLGPPGSDKKMVSKYLSNLLDNTFISTSAIINFILEDKNHPFHRVVAESISNSLVHDNLILKMIESKVVKETKGIIFSGFPKTTEQAKQIDKLLFRKHDSINHVIYLDLDENTIFNKLYGRLFCESCHRTYPSSINYSICPICNGNILSSNFTFEEKPEEDDTDIDEVKITQKDKYSNLIKEKIINYDKQIKTVLSYYTQQNKILRIKLIGNESYELIVAKIMEHLE